MNLRSDPVRATIKIPSDTKYVKEALEKILKTLEPYEIDSAVLYDIKLCVDEAIVNAIVHGNNKDKRLSVTIEYRLEGGKFIAEVRDEGRGFDHAKRPDPTTDANLMKGSGRGVYLIHRLMDKVEYNDKGNRIKLTKYIKT